MKICVLYGSPNKRGNTAALAQPFLQEMDNHGATTEVFWLHDVTISPCIACRTCQKDWSRFGCPFQDGVQDIFDCILASDVILLATPIYSWYCTAPMKALLDRLVYGMNKYYGAEKGPSLWKGKTMALITTCGYPPEKGADLWAEGMRRYCKHSQLFYYGMLAERYLGYKTTFMDGEKAEHARKFARDLLRNFENQ